METQIIEVKDGAIKDKHASAAERKAHFVRQGEIYRIGVARSKAQVVHEAQPQALFHSAVDHATAAVRLRVDSLLTPRGLSVATLLPYALPLLRMVRRHQFGNKAKIGLGVVTVLSGLGAYWRRKHQRDAAY